jgi:hypothetical protein
MLGGFAGGAVAASGDSLYVARGIIVYRLRASDLTELAHAALPMTAVAGAAGTSSPLTVIAPPLGAPAAPAPPAAAPGAAAPGVAPPPPGTVIPLQPGAAATPPAADAGWLSLPGGLMGGMMATEPESVSIAAAGPNVYVLRGNILYQLRASDLMLVSSRALPSPGGAGMMTPGMPLTPPGTPGGVAPRTRRGRRVQSNPTAPGTLDAPSGTGSAPAAPGF